MLRRSVIETLTLALLLAVGPGCRSTLGPPGHRLLPSGRETRSAELFHADVGAVSEAVSEAMGDLSMDRLSTDAAPGSSRGRDAAISRASAMGPESSRTIRARSADGRDLVVEVRPVGNGSVVGARVGRQGDVPLERTLLDRVGVRLGTKSPEPIPELPPVPSRSVLPHLSRGAVSDAEIFRDQAAPTYRDTPIP